MPQVLKCPSCAATLDYPETGGASMHCPYCGCTVMLGDTLPSDEPISAFDTSAIGKAVEIAQVAALARAGNKIEAIKLYRKHFNVDLATAKTAVEHLAAGRSIHSEGMSVQVGDVSAQAMRAVNNGLKFAAILTIVILVITGIIITSVFRAVHRQVNSITTSLPHAVLPSKPVLASTPALPATPAFAKSVLEFGMDGIGAGQFDDARAIAVDANGNIYVAEYSDGRIQIFDPTGKFVAMWNLGQNKYVMSLAVDRKGTLYVVTNGDILRYEAATGMPLGAMDKGTGDSPQHYQSVYAAVNGDLYAIGMRADIVILGPDGMIKTVIPVRDNLGESVGFTSIAVMGDGNIFALDTSKGIFKFAPDGRYLNRFGGGTRKTPGKVSRGNTLAVDGKGRLYLGGVDPVVQVWDSEGNYIDTFGGTDVSLGMAMDDQDNSYLMLRNKHKVVKYSLVQR